MRNVIVKTLVVSALLSGTLGIASISDAKSKTPVKVDWSFNNRNLEHGATIVAKIQSVTAPTGSKLVFQRTFGTTSLYKTIKTLTRFRSSAFSVALPSVPVGFFEYRILIQDSGRLLYTSPKNVLHSYGPVAFSTICSEMVGGSGGCNPGSVQLGNSSVFTYQASTIASATAAPGTNEFTFSNLSCRYGDLEVAVGLSQATNSGLTATIQVAEAAQDPQLSTVSDTTTALFHFKLNRGAVYIDDWYSGGSATAADGYGENDEYVWFSGSFDCYTLNGLIGK